MTFDEPDDFLPTGDFRTEMAQAINMLGDTLWDAGFNAEDILAIDKALRGARTSLENNPGLESRVNISFVPGSRLRISYSRGLTFLDIYVDREF